MIRKLCYECYDDHIYATVGFEGLGQAEEYYAEMVERKQTIKCPNCKREIDYGEER